MAVQSSLRFSTSENITLKAQLEPLTYGDDSAVCPVGGVVILNIP